MVKIFSSPNRYIQGKGALKRLGEECKKLGLSGKAFVLGSNTADVKIRNLWEEGLKKGGFSFHFEKFNGECTSNEVERVAKCAENFDFLVGIGGGKVLDTTRAVSQRLKKEVVVCPTMASTDAPCISVYVMYNEQGEMVDFNQCRKNAILVVADTEVIAASPKRQLVSGMGDAMATFYEAKTCKESHARNFFGGEITEAGLCLSSLCKDLLYDQGKFAIQALEAKTPNEALEKIVEANTLLSGLGVELCGVAAAHAIHNGLTVLPETKMFLHGEKVAFGLLAQFLLEGKPRNEMEKLIDFYHEIGLPLCLEDLGIINPTREMMQRVAKRSTREGETIHNEPMGIREDMVVDLLLSTDSLGRQYRKTQVRCEKKRAA